MHLNFKINQELQTYSFKLILISDFFKISIRIRNYLSFINYKLVFKNAQKYIYKYISKMLDLIEKNAYFYLLIVEFRNLST